MTKKNLLSIEEKNKLMQQSPINLVEGLGIKQLIQDPKEFRKMRFNELTNKLYLSEQENLVQQDLLREMESRAERMVDNVKISEDAIKELEKDPTHEAREKKKKVELELKGWSDKLTSQQKEINETKNKTEALQENIFNLGLYLKHLKE